MIEGPNDTLLAQDSTGADLPETDQGAGDYTCPMHPEVRQNGPGNCPKCGMVLDPISAPTAAGTGYVCPMHPEIVRTEPGSCPICGMALEPRAISAKEGENPELKNMRRRF